MLVQHCYECHSADASARKKLKGGLRLDTAAALRAGGDSGPALVVGKPAESLMIRAVHHAEEGIAMPPKAKLPDAAIADLEKWVAMGAPDPRGDTRETPAAGSAIDVEAGRQFWSLRPLASAEPPAVQDRQWVRTPVDQFIRARQETKGLRPAPAAGREQLVRRAYFDLLGLPPTAEQVDAFVNDTAPDAWERLIDRLLSSERYGERWARHWLDVARYAESGGYEFDRDRQGTHHYRDWVIRAFNADMPYDRFVRLQLAGDKLHPNDFEAAAATGFVVAGPYPGQTTAKTLEPIRYDHLDDMVSTVGSAMLGMTLTCARCHDHKYDPILQEDYYRLAACFARTDSATLQLDPKPEIYRDAKAAFDKAHAPLVKAWEQFLGERFEARFDEWRATQPKAAAPWLLLDLVSAQGGKSPMRILDDGSALATDKPQRDETYTFVAETHLKGLRTLRLEALADESLPRERAGRGKDGEFLLAGIALKASPLAGKGKPVDLKLRAVAASSEERGQPLADALLDDKDRKARTAKDAKVRPGWSPRSDDGNHAAVFEIVPPAKDGIAFEGGVILTLTLKFAGDAAIGRPRIAISTAADAGLGDSSMPQNAPEIAALLDEHKGALNEKNRGRIIRWFRKVDPEARKLHGAIEKHAASEPKPELVGVFAAGEKGRDVHFLVRGDTARKGSVATPGFVAVLMERGETGGRWVGAPAGKSAPPTEPRVALGNWMTDTEHGAGHLLARVIVNRLWQHHMGRGIVATPNDFGAQGEPPTHPELLDYLARELVQQQWRLKPLHKLIMTSAVYMQGGEAIPANVSVDPDNRLWWRRPSRRLEAEAVRDALLAVAGKLDTKMYGPSITDETSTRRSIYLSVKRSKPHPMLQLFDSPEAIQSTGQRQVTTVATQALAMMNSPLVRQRAQELAQRIPNASADPRKAIDQACRVALGRSPTSTEQQRLLAFMEAQAKRYGEGPKAAEGAFVDVCHALLCSSDFIYVD